MDGEIKSYHQNNDNASSPTTPSWSRQISRAEKHSRATLRNQDERHLSTCITSPVDLFQIEKHEIGNFDEGYIRHEQAGGSAVVKEKGKQAGK